MTDTNLLAATLAEIDAQIVRLKALSKQKQAAIDADVAKHVDEMDHALQGRLDQELTAIRQKIRQLRARRGQVEIEGVEAPEPSTTPAIADSKTANWDYWDIEAVSAGLPAYPFGLRQTPGDHQKIFAETLDGFIEWYRAKVTMVFRDAGIRPGDNVATHTVASFFGQICTEGEYHVLRFQDAEQCIADLEKRLAEVEGHGIRDAGVWQTDNAYRPGDAVTFTGHSGSPKSK